MMTKNYKYHDTWRWGSYASPWPDKSLLWICNYLLLCQYMAYWLLLYYGIIMLLSNAIVDFYLFYDGVLHMQIWVPLTRSQCKVSDTQVTLKACGSLVLQYTIMRLGIQLWGHPYCTVQHLCFKSKCTNSAPNYKHIFLTICI